ncbi:hypothetical protein [Calidifontibacillus oryziterrae]|uniref:hypothetical protein n=1 Tax=Calidifontibacillus oryziterrae TaxID=1191699 RepID=UPI00031BDFFA|nr:hypothetical protein [Calidifontibacillus oryziterrae]
MDILYLKKCVKNIQVKNMVNADVEVVNKSPLKMMGKGRQGAVFQFTDDICVKVFGNEEDCEREYYALSLGQKSSLFPKLYAKGPLYIAMEIVKGVDVREYLQSQPLTKALSEKLIEMLIIFKKIGFERIDHHKRQIYLQPDGNLKVIDVARTVWRDRVYPYPRKLLTSLGEENKEIFLTHVQEMAPELYEEWKHYIRMEELSRQIYQGLIVEKSINKKNKKRTKSLLTTKDDQKYVIQLEGLMHKVFKEEWVKTMLAQGYDPDAVMEKIDKHWEKYEQKGNGNLNKRNLSKRKKRLEKAKVKAKVKAKGKSEEKDKDSKKKKNNENKAQTNKEKRKKRKK